MISRNLPDNIGNDTSDPRSPLYEPTLECGKCGFTLILTKEYDPDLGQFYVAYCKKCDVD